MKEQRQKKSSVVAEWIHRTLSQYIQTKLRDPRIPKWVSIAEVKVSSDLSSAKIYITGLIDSPEEAISALNHAAGHLRSVLAKSSEHRTVPMLHFVFDNTLVYAQKLTRLIDEVNQNIDE